MTRETKPPEPAFRILTEKISRERGFGCASYKEKCLRRRIAVRMRARGVHTYDAYASLLDQDTREYDLLLDALTINVTKFFRNPETFDAIAEQVIPALWRLSSPTIRVWSAGCASGEEPYSLAMLFHRYATSRGEGHRLHRVSILASDIDRASLRAAERGSYDEMAFADTAPELRRRYFSIHPPFEINSAVKALVRFERRDLLSEHAPPGMHLIFCRNVIIYFDRVTQETLFRQFHDALAPGGFLVLGKVETLLGPTRSLFATVSARERVFRRR